MRNKQQWKKRLVEIKQNKITEAKINAKTQSIYQSYATYKVVTADVLWYCC